MNFKKIWKGLQIVAESVLDLNAKGQVQVDDSSGKAHYHNGTTSSPIVTEAHSGTLTNKTIDADNNTVSNIENDNIKAAAGIAESKLSLDYSTSSLNTAITDHISDTTDAHDASAISNAPSGNLAATDVQAALNELQGDIDTTNSNVSSVTTDVADLVTLSGVTANSTDLGTFTGTTIPDNSDVKEALQALETEVESKIDASDLTTHENDTSTHGVAGAIVGTSDSQTLTNKTIVVANNTVTTAATGNLAATELNAALAELQGDIDTRATSSALTTHTSASTGVHGVTGSVVGTSDTQTLTNKDIDGGTASNTNRITLPKAAKATLDGLTRKEATLVYASDLDKVYYDDGTNLRAVGSGSGSDINYIENGDAETGTTGWATYADAAGTIPVDGTGGTASQTSFYTLTSSAKARGSASFGLAKVGSGSGQGQGVSYDFTIDNADKAKQLTISFDYNASSTYNDGWFKVFVYDVTNNTLIRVNGEDILAGGDQTNGVYVKHYARFQTSIDSTSYRLIIHNSTTHDTVAATDFILNFDNVQVSPKSIVYGSPITDWTSYTPTFAGLGTVTNIDFYYRRVGDTLEIYGSGTTGTVTATTASISLPSGLVTSANINSTSPRGSFYLSGSTADAVDAYRLNIIASPSDTTVGIGERTSAASNEVLKRAGNSIAGNSLNFNVLFSVPIQGWSANAAMSEDLGNRTIFARMRSTAAQLVNSAAELVIFQAVDFDTVGMANISTERFTIPETGVYIIGASGSVTTFTNFDDGEEATIEVRVNGANNTDSFAHYPFSTDGGQSFNFATQPYYLNKGDYVELWVNNIASDPTTETFELSPGTYFSITKIASPQTIFETETVAAVYNDCSQNIPSSVSTIVTFDTKIQDTHNAYDTATGAFTIFTSGYYHISASFGLTGASASGYYFPYISTSSGETIYGNRLPILTINVQNIMSFTYYFNKGDTFSIGINQTEGTTRPLNSTFCNFSVARIK
jgi:hypothetical protein